MIEYMIDETISKLIERGEMAREHSEYPEALQYLDQALVVAGDAGRPEDIVEMLGHRLIIYKHLAELTGQAVYFELMYGDTLTGMHIVETFKLSGQPKAVMLLRQGDYFLAKKDHNQAVSLYGQAIELLDQSNKGQYAEYLAYYGLALVMNDQRDEGLARIAEALKFAENSTDLRPFHKLVVVSGMHIRYAQAYLSLEENDETRAKVKEHLVKAREVAQELADQHDITIRLEQIKRLAEKSGIELT